MSEDRILTLCYLLIAPAVVGLGYWLDVVTNRQRQKKAGKRRANV